MRSLEELKNISEPALVFEISECDAPLDEIISAIESAYPDWRFRCTTEMYESCVMAWFENPAFSF